MSVQPKDPHFELLAAGYFDEVLDQAGQDELKSLLHEDDRRVKRFAQLAQLDQMINSEIAYHHEAKRFGLSSASSESGAARALVELASLYEDGLQDPMNFASFREERAKKASADRRKQWLSRTLISGVVAAALLLAVTLLAAVFTGNPPDTQVADQQPNDPETNDPIVPAIPSRAVATLTNTHNAKWASPQAEGASAPGSHLSVGSPLHPNQRLTLTQGFAEITTARGAIAILEAPATIELLNENAIRLHTGKLVGLCHTESSKGFIVRTPHMDITDLGTEFGVHARPGAVTTTVFTGEVELATPDAAPQRINQHQTAELTVNGINRDLVIEDKLAEGFDNLIRPAIVTAARINLEGFTAQVVPRGVREDALLYTDRPHELNGVDETGIPSILLKGDLIQMPADARRDLTPGIDSLTLEIDTHHPADVYILFPKHESPPAWLTRDYAQTDMVVGNDRGEGLRGETPGIGPGQSIDASMHVWKRNQPAVGTTTVSGPMVRTMYSIIVVPIVERGAGKP